MIKKVIKKTYRWCMEQLSVCSPVYATKLLYFIHFHKWLDLNNPQTLNEKILWLKLNTYNNNPLVTKCADKYRVREYVAEKGCPEILNELYGVWNHAEEIEWTKLPDSFAMKCNHGCGYNIICSDKQKLNEAKTKIQLNKWLSEDFWKRNAEVNYRQIEKKIICEKYIQGKHDERLNDYKVYCFHGKALFILFCIDKERKFYFFDREWNFLRINPDGLSAPKSFHVEKPACIEKLLEYAERLSEPFPFVRVDFYVEQEKIIFGEMTFTPAAGLDTARLKETDMFFGELLKL